MYGEIMERIPDFTERISSYDSFAARSNKYSMLRYNVSRHMTRDSIPSAITSSAGKI